jgi:hypothetical protein
MLVSAQKTLFSPRSFAHSDLSTLPDRSTLNAVAKDIDQRGLDVEHLRTEYDMLREEAVDMEWGRSGTMHIRAKQELPRHITGGNCRVPPLESSDLHSRLKA